jgi:hypothetical protein
MLGYGNISNYGPSWWEWGGGTTGTNTVYPCTGTETKCDPKGDNICPASTSTTDAAFYFPLDEGEGSSAIDVGLNGNDGTIIGTVSWRTDGIKGNGLWFTGDQIEEENTYIEVPDDPSIDFSSGFTYAMWIRPEQTDPGYHMKTFLWKGGVNNNILLQYCTALGALKFLYSPGVANLVGFTYPYGEWLHIAVTHDGGILNSGTVKIYVDGNEAYSKSGVPPLPSTTEPIWIGRSGNFDTANQTYEHFHGTMDEVYLFNRALTGEEILSLATP